MVTLVENHILPNENKVVAEEDDNLNDRLDGECIALLNIN